jgi:hypothetical protein
MSQFRSLPSMFIPHIGQVARVIREGILIRDLTMPARHWPRLDAPAVLRVKPDSARARKEAA